MKALKLNSNTSDYRYSESKDGSYHNWTLFVHT